MHGRSLWSWGSAVIASSSVLALAACGSSGSATAGAVSRSTVTTAGGAATSSTAAGRPFAGRSFTTVIPAGWSDKTGSYGNSGNSGETPVGVFGAPGDQAAVIIAANASYVANLVALPAASAYREGGTNVTSPRAVNVGGETGQFVTFDKSTSGTRVRYQLILVDHANTTWSIIYDGASGVFNSEMSALDAVLAAWKWT